MLDDSAATFLDATASIGETGSWSESSIPNRRPKEVPPLRAVLALMVSKPLSTGRAKELCCSVACRRNLDVANMAGEV